MIDDKKLISWAKQKKQFGTQDVTSKFAVSRQTAATHLRRLVESGVLSKTGSTRNALYSTLKSPAQNHHLQLVKKIKNLEEDKVLDEVCSRLPLKSLLSRNVFSIFGYVFSEMLNNAIDHSDSEKTWIEVKVEKGILTLLIKDLGIGAFANVQRFFKLENEFEAAHHLFKGKQTTFAARHSGQGIFFTSRLADIFHLQSHAIDAKIDNERDDFILLAQRKIQGTLVSFQIKARSKKNLQKVFQDHSGENFEFNHNNVRVRLVGDELVSRSQARRFLAGLEAFDRITFDFKKIKGIGQAFADEIFRVFQNRHPQIKIDFENAQPHVLFMIARVNT